MRHPAKRERVAVGVATSLLLYYFTPTLLAAAAFLAGLLGMAAAGTFIIARRAVICVPVLVFGAAVAGGLVGWLLGKSALPSGVRDQGTATQHPNIKSMEAQGWKIGAKPRV